jgi:hypothetical protein
MAAPLPQGLLQALELGFRGGEGLLQAFTLGCLLRGSEQRRDLAEQAFEDRADDPQVLIPRPFGTRGQAFGEQPARLRI